MRIQYLANGVRRVVRADIGATLVARGIARELASEPEPAPAPAPPPAGTYSTREMQPASKLDKLRAECDRRGIKYHHRAGEAKLRELLKD